jgi:hypothetical protein
MKPLQPFWPRFFVALLLSLCCGRISFAQNTDTIAPTLTYLQPSDAAVLNNLPPVRGTVADNEGGSGIDRVTLAIFRVSDQSWWNGSAWTATFTELTTNLSDNTWERNTGLPRGADLRDGQLVLIALGYDEAGNRAELDNTISIDTTAPTQVAFTQPESNELIGRFTSIIGNVQDNTGGSGINKVDVFIRRSNDGLYWSGTAWVAEPVALPAQTGGGFFTRNTALPSGAQLPSGTYLLTAIAEDVAGNRAVGTSSARVVADTVAPTLTYSFPAANGILRQLGRVAGTATDNNGGSSVARVEFGLLRSVDQRWWSGTSWVSDFVALPATLKGNTWSRAAGLPTGSNLRDGAYVIVGFAYDRVGNRGQRDTNFIIDTTAPTALTITSPTNGARVGTLAPFSGTVSDNTGGSGIDRVEVFIRRANDGRYWSGRNWATIPVALPATQGTNNSWTRAGTPGGTNLQQTIYYLTAIAYDRAGNRTTTTSSVRVADLTPPTVTITAPAPDDLQGNIPPIIGTITDTPGGSGPARVLLAIRRASDGRYWNGSTWTTTSSTIAATLTGNGTTWARTSGFPTGTNLIRDTYTIIAIGFDRAGNRAEDRISFPVIPDTTGPTLTVDSPRQNTTVQSLSRVSGTVRDEGSGVARVGVAVLRSSDQLWWNGRTWTDRFTLLPAIVSGNTWTISSGLPPSSETPRGFYVVIAQAFDRIGNQTQIDRNIAIDANAPAQTNARSISGLSTATVVGDQIRLMFRVPLQVTDAAQFNVTVNGQSVDVEEVLWNAGSRTLTLSLPEGSVQSGANLQVAWSELAAAGGQVLSGATSILAR